MMRTGSLSALVIFAKFRGEAPGVDLAPSWASDLFNRGRPGSFAHFYDEMSGGRLHVDGQVLPRRYSSQRSADTYLAAAPGALGEFGRFNLEILEQADADVDMGEFDNDGVDGVPNSGDDDGYVDIVFINLLTVPRDFFVSGATGLASLGLDTDYISDDAAVGGGFIRIRSRFTGFGGTTQRGHVFSVTAATMCHEFGHVLGLSDLFDQSSVRADGELEPEEDSAGIGKWGLMGLGTLGWGVEDGPNAFCAWSLAQLGWVEVVEIAESVRDLSIEDVVQGEKVYKIPLTREEYFLLENRQASGSYYNRNVPQSGLLIWHVDERADNDEERHKQVDLVCADGLFADRGFPDGRPDPVAGKDNLDFWAKDPTYAAAHSGNQGDATDPFDGVRFTRFAHDTNPNLSAYVGFARKLPIGIEVDNIRADGKRMIVDVLLRRTLDGHIGRDTTWSGEVEVIRDIVVEPGATLTIAPGTRVVFSSFDWERSGYDENLCELLVFGDLVLQGTSEAPVRLAASQRRSQWAGIFLLDGQEIDLNDVEIENARHGLVRFRLPPGETRWSDLQKIPFDLVVPDDAELVVAPGTQVQFGLDLGRRGIAPLLTELIVEGRLVVEGNSTRPARFTVDPLEEDGIWYGLRLRPGSQIDIRFLQVDRAGFGFSGQVSADSRLRIADSWIGDNAADGLRLTINGQAELERTTFTRNTNRAIHAEGSGELRLRDITVEGNGREGIFLGNISLKGSGLIVERSGLLDTDDPRSGLLAVGGRGQRIELRESRLANNTLHGLELNEWEGLLELRDSEVISNRRDGLQAAGLERLLFVETAVERNLGNGATVSAAPVEVRNSSFTANIGAGLALGEGASGSIEESVFRSGSGLEIADVDRLSVRGNRFENSPLALVSRNAAPSIEGNRFAGNQIAVQVRGGKVPLAVRRNLFIDNHTAIDNLSTQALQAQENYWGTADSIAISELISGLVEWVPFLDREPDSTVVEEGENAVPTFFALHPAYPNPFNGEVNIVVDIARAVTAKLVVYNALGQPVQRLLEAVLKPGFYRLTWDGRDDNGQEVGSGVFLFRLQAGEFAAVKRVLLVR